MIRPTSPHPQPQGAPRDQRPLASTVAPGSVAQVVIEIAPPPECDGAQDWLTPYQTEIGLWAASLSGCDFGGLVVHQPAVWQPHELTALVYTCGRHFPVRRGAALALAVGDRATLTRDWLGLLRGLGFSDFLLTLDTDQLTQQRSLAQALDLLREYDFARPAIQLCSAPDLSQLCQALAPVRQLLKDVPLLAGHPPEAFTGDDMPAIRQLYSSPRIQLGPGGELSLPEWRAVKLWASDRYLAAIASGNLPLAEDHEAQPPIENNN